MQLPELWNLLSASQSGRIALTAECYSQIPASQLSKLREAGILAATAAPQLIECPGCENRCLAPVQHRKNSAGIAQSYIICEWRDDIGPVSLSPAAITRYECSLFSVAQWIMTILPTDRDNPSAIGNGRAYALGTTCNNNLSLYLACCFQDIPATLLGTQGNAARLLLLEPPDTLPDYPCLTLDGLVSANINGMTLNSAAIIHATMPALATDRIAWEVRLVRRRIVLYNRINGQQRELARPDFNSVTDNAAEYIFQHEGILLTEEVLEEAIGQPLGRTLHKLVERMKD